MNDRYTQDLFESRTARDEALEQVERLDFSEQVQKEVPLMRQYVDEFTGEDLRHWMEIRGIEAHDPHAWGGVIWSLRTRGQIVPIGYRQMKDKSSHARETKLYRWV